MTSVTTIGSRRGGTLGADGVWSWFILVALNDQHMDRINFTRKRLSDSYSQTYIGMASDDIHNAAKSGNLDKLRKLIAEGVDVNKPNKKGITPLMYAIANKHEKVVKELLKHPQIDIEKQSDDGKRPIHWAAEMYNLEILNTLLDKGADINSETSSNKLTALHIAAYYGFDSIVKELIKRGASIDKKTTDGHTPLLVALLRNSLESFKIILDAGADVNVMYKNPQGVPITPLRIVCNSPYTGGLVKTILETPTLDRDSEVTKSVIQNALAGKYSPDIRVLIFNYMADDPSAEKLKGWTKSDAKVMDNLFGEIEEMREHAGNERYSFVPLDDMTYCPVCLAYTPRLAKRGETKNTNETKGCMYMYHKCKDTPGAIVNEYLYQKYRNPEGMIYWCTICNRIALGHKHYQLDSAYAITTPRLIEAVGSPFDKSCKPGHGGGGIEEKILRFMRLREIAKKLNADAGKISKQKALNILTVQMWNARRLLQFPKEKEENEKRLKAAIANKKFPNNSENFLPNRANENEENRNYPNKTRSAENLAALKPEISETPKWDSVEVEALAPAVLFHHRDTEGHVVHHKKGEGNDGDGGEWLSFKTVTTLIENYAKNYSDADFGKCIASHTCKARLYPDEIKGIVPEDLYEKYRKAFNKRFKDGVKGGGGRRSTRRVKQVGGTFAGMFRPLDDEKCVAPWKKNTRKGLRK